MLVKGEPKKVRVLGLLRNVNSDVEFRISTGSLFQTDGAADRKARTPMTVFVRGTVSVPASVDLSELVVH